MLKAVKTTTLAILATLTLTAGISTQASAATPLPSAHTAQVKTLAAANIAKTTVKLANFGHGHSKFGHYSKFGYKSDYYYGSDCLLYTSPSPRDQRGSRMPSSA